MAAEDSEVVVAAAVAVVAVVSEVAEVSNTKVLIVNTIKRGSRDSN